MELTIKPISKNNVTNLANLLNYDDSLITSLDSRKLHIITSTELFSDLEKWQIGNNANSYVILLNKNTIGLISLSHQDNRQARVGYWIASSEWGKGYTSAAFKQIVAIAKNQGFIKLSATIDPSNIASKRIWEKSGAVFTKKDGKINATLGIV